MKYIKLSLIFIFLQALTVINAHANQLTNNGFEDNPPSGPGWGNNLNHPILPCIISGGSSNVIRADGDSTRFGSDQGPWKDATNSPVGTVRHYLDIVGPSPHFSQ